MLLRAYRHRLRPADLEECLGQAALELILAARRGRRFECDGHIANAFDQRFLSRVADLQRAAGGRSPGRAHLEEALARDSQEELNSASAGCRDSVEQAVLVREELEDLVRAAQSLSADERVVLASRLGFLGDATDICASRGWSSDRYRKLAQRGRERLRRAGLEADLSLAGGKGTPS